MNDDSRAPLIERARGGDWDAIEDLVSGTVAPTFDAALHLLGDPAEAARQTEEALLALLVAVRRGEIKSGDPLIINARALSAAAQAARSSPFSSGLAPEDLIAIGRRPDEARRSELGIVPAVDRTTAVLAFALDLGPDEMATALGKTPSEIRAAVDHVLAAIPHDRPDQALRDMLDARASHARLPIDIEDRVLDRFEEQER